MATVVRLAVLVLFPMAAPPNFFELTSALLRLLAVFAVFADGLLQVLFRFADVTAACLIPIGTGGRSHHCQ